LRNHGFLHADRGHWRLAPAFDVNPFPDRVRELKTWVSEDAGPEATIEALMSVLPYFRIALPRAQQILREVEQAVSRWRYVGRGLGMTTQELDQFADAFEHEERAAARTASQ
jgi:serine/threonine-protein kinase HipA